MTRNQKITDLNFRKARVMEAMDDDLHTVLMTKSQMLFLIATKSLERKTAIMEDLNRQLAAL